MRLIVEVSDQERKIKSLEKKEGGKEGNLNKK